MATVTFSGNSGNDYITCAPGQNYFVYGLAGNDTLIGGDRADTLSGGPGHDRMTGGAGNDSLVGGDGSDIFEGGAGADTFNDGIGADMLTYANSTVGVYVDLDLRVFGGGDAAGDFIAGAIYNVTGSSKNDVLAAHRNGGVLDGGIGDDTFYLSSGRVVVLGGAGVDSVVLRAPYGGGAYVNLQSGVANVAGIAHSLSAIENAFAGANGDVLIGTTGGNRLDGGGGNDSIDGGGGADVLLGGEGADTILGGDGNDVMDGGGGRNMLNGGSGDDVVRAGPEADVLIGGWGRDVFAFGNTPDSLQNPSNYDVIRDFQPGTDVINVAAIDANPYAQYDQAFTLRVDGSGFTGLIGDMYFHRASSKIFADNDGDRVADYIIVLEGVAAVTAANFIL